MGDVADRPGWVVFAADTVRGRSCGSCTACCTQVPVDLPTGHKAANVRCPAVYSRGCRVYATRPKPCRAWSCRWLFDPATAELRRPDQSGYVVDAMLDTILADGQPIDVVQVWCNPARRDAHRDPALRAYLQGVYDRFSMPAIVRWSSAEGGLLVPPNGSGEGEWLLLESTLHSKEAMARELARAGHEPYKIQAEFR